MSDDGLPAELRLGCFVPLVLVLLLATVAGGVYALDGLTGEKLTSSMATVIGVEPRGRDEQGEQRVQCYVVAYEVAGASHRHRTCDVTLVLDRRDRRRQEDERYVEAQFAARHPVGSKVKVLRQADPPYEARGPVVERSIAIGGGRGLVTIAIGVVVMVLFGSPLTLLVLSKVWRGR